MKKCVFVGPTLPWVPCHAGVDFFEPAHQGSIFRAVKDGFRVIGLIDGYFGNVPSVWHKEVLYAIHKGVAVFGSASMGALRAAELSDYGMVGVGLIYRLFRKGVLTDDDEVCVTHAPPELGFKPLSQAMIDFRFTLKTLCRKRLVTSCIDEMITTRLKKLYFSERTLDSLWLILIAEYDRARADELFNLICSHFVSLKHRDALEMIAIVEQCRRPADSVQWSFPCTDHFRQQFELELTDVPHNRLRWSGSTCRKGQREAI